MKTINETFIKMINSLDKSKNTILMKHLYAKIIILLWKLKISQSLQNEHVSYLNKSINMLISNLSKGKEKTW